MTTMDTLREVVGRAARTPLFVKVGAIAGLLAGGVAGVILSSPAGMLFGLSIGTSLGIVAGMAIDRDDKRAQRRTRELDAIIGVTSGNLGGAQRVSSPDALEREAELASWVTEWMTPAAPAVLPRA